MLFGVQIALLAFPQILLSDSVRVGTVAVHHDGLDDAHARRLAAEIDRRLGGSRFHDSNRQDRVFVFRSRRTYRFYLKLLFMRVEPQGFNLPVFRNSYVCEPIVNELGDATGRHPRFSIWEGDLAHTAAHEIGHQYVVDRIGRARWRELPHWKQEGLPEYIANIGPVRADRSQSLADRIEVLVDDGSWSGTPAGRRPGWDRLHYEAGLMVEFLLEVQGLTLEQVVSDRVSRSDTHAAMISWASSQGA